jgi:hypothetical protein
MNKVAVFACIALTSCGALALPSTAQQTRGDVLTDTRAPYVRLFDTVAPLPDPLPSPANSAAWSLVKDGDVTHAFTGDAVFLNDRVVVLLRKGGAGAQVYAKTPGGLKPRAQIVPCPLGAGDIPALASVRVLENKSSAVTVEASFKTKGGAGSSASFRLATGDVLLEAKAGAGTGRLALRGSIRYVVIPDYFGDDMVFGAHTSDAPRVGLPAENFFLSLLEGGDAIVMCVWPSGQRNADLVLTGASGERAIGGCEVESREGESMWVAFLEGAGIWHGKALPAEGQGTDIALEWKPPFPAKWRADLVGRDGVCESWDLVDQQEHERQLKTAGSSFGLAEPACPCWFDPAGAHVSVPRARPAAAPGALRPEQELMVIYPMDRDRATPLTRFCPVDIVRNALGVGPCQYILDLEGFPQGDAATAAEVTRWVEKQFEKKKDEQESAAIKERLAQMVGHMANAQARAEQYSDFARQVQAVCKDQERNAAAAETARSLQRIAEDMQQSAAKGREAMKTRGYAKGRAEAMIAAIGQKRPLAEVQGIGEELRSIGAAQDRALSRCRLAVRRLKQECRMAAAAHPEAADFVTAIRDQAGKLLQKK